ncbi:MAG: AbrB/MazE/SpoVT family DNA-binding domain-containing protein [Candidatus Fimivivens sp.]|nr:AbrB/MazE/SpoVT family DNA-binding domain-containing protein [Candidatus Fimivivens sp.]
MKQFARNIDDLGRVVLPKEIRRANNIDTGDLLAIEVVPAGILLTPMKACCVICGSTNNLVTVHDTAICRDCIDAAGKEPVNENQL